MRCGTGYGLGIHDRGFCDFTVHTAFNDFNHDGLVWASCWQSLVYSRSGTSHRLGPPQSKSCFQQSLALVPMSTLKATENFYPRCTIRGCRSPTNRRTHRRVLLYHATGSEPGRRNNCAGSAPNPWDLGTTHADEFLAGAGLDVTNVRR